MPQRAGLSHLGISAMESAAEGITIAHMTDPDQPLVFVNQGFTNMTGYRADDILGRNCRFLQGPDTDREQVAALRRAIDARESITVELLNYTRTKEPFWNRLTLAPIAKEAGGPEDYYVGVQFDVTEYKVMQRRIQHYADSMKTINTEAEAAIRTLSESLSGLSSGSVRAVQEISARLGIADQADMRAMLDSLQASLHKLNETISGLKVIMENCGGISGFVHIDPVTLQVKDRG